MLNDNIRKGQPLVAGSLAYDKVMDYPGLFSAAILPGRSHDLNLNLVLEGIDSSFGGTAGNIAYNLALLQERSFIAGAGGHDFSPYLKHLESLDLDLRALSLDKKGLTSAAFVITDKSDNQISAFYPGSQKLAKLSALKKTEVSLAIISPDNKERMLAAYTWLKKNKIPYIFDPGQQSLSFSKNELRLLIDNSLAIIGNDYETELIKDRLGLREVHHIHPQGVLISTQGKHGSILFFAGKRTKVKAVRLKKSLDPTGAGDAYRAGLIKGLTKGYNWQEAMSLASTVASFAVEKVGTQEHKFSIKQLKQRYASHFSGSLDL